MLISTSEKPCDYWQEHIAAFLSGSLSKMKYCRESKVAYHQFLYRYNRYRKKQKSSQGYTTPSKPSFATLKITTPQSSPHPFQVTLPNGIKFGVPAIFDKKVLQELLEVLNS